MSLRERKGEGERVRDFVQMFSDSQEMNHIYSVCMCVEKDI